MFWADTAIKDFIKQRKKSINSKKSIVIRDEKTPSGRVHIGSMRGVAMHGIFSRILAWAAKFKVFDVDIEGEGKDHATKGGSREIADRISREVFGYEPPYDVWYEFFLIGDRKMSSLKWTGATASGIVSLIPAKIFQLAILGKAIRRAINFDPEGDTIPYSMISTINLQKNTPLELRTMTLGYSLLFIKKEK